MLPSPRSRFDILCDHQELYHAIDHASRLESSSWSLLQASLVLTLRTWTDLMSLTKVLTFFDESASALKRGMTESSPVNAILLHIPTLICSKTSTYIQAPDKQLLIEQTISQIAASPLFPEVRQSCKRKRSHRHLFLLVMRDEEKTQQKRSLIPLASAEQPSAGEKSVSRRLRHDNLKQSNDLLGRHYLSTHSTSPLLAHHPYHSS